MDMVHCPCSGASLARLIQPAAMAVMAERPLHGYELVQRLQRMRMFRVRRPDPAGVYRLLKDMERRGLVVSGWELSDSGPAKRRFELTADGRECLARWTRTLADYRSAIANLLEFARKSAPHGTRVSTSRRERRRG